MTTSIPESQTDANRPIVPEAPPLLTLQCRRSFTEVSFLFLKSSLEFEVSDILADDVKREFDVLLNVIPRKQTVTIVSVVQIKVTIPKAKESICCCQWCQSRGHLFLQSSSSSIFITETLTVNRHHKQCLQYVLSNMNVLWKRLCHNLHHFFFHANSCWILLSHHSTRTFVSLVDFDPLPNSSANSLLISQNKNFYQSCWSDVPDQHSFRSGLEKCSLITSCPRYKW